MGNRASIYIKPARKTIYLQWNGGPGSVDAFINEAKKRSGVNGKIDKDFIFYLHHAIRDYFDFCTDIKYRKRDTLSLYVESGESINDSDNGHYTLDSRGKLSRQCGEYCSAEDPSYTKESYKGITEFFEQLDSVLLTTDWDKAS